MMDSLISKSKYIFYNAHYFQKHIFSFPAIILIFIREAELN